MPSTLGIPVDVRVDHGCPAEHKLALGGTHARTVNHARAKECRDDPMIWGTISARGWKVEGAWRGGLLTPEDQLCMVCWVLDLNVC